MSTPRLDPTFADAVRERLVSEVEQRETLVASRHHRSLVLAVAAGVVAIVVGLTVVAAAPWFGGSHPNPAEVGAPDGDSDSAPDSRELRDPHCQDLRSAAEVRTCLRQYGRRGTNAPGELDPLTEEWLEGVRNNEPGELSVLVEGPDVLDPVIVDECRFSLANGTRGPVHPLYCNALVLMADGDIPTGHHYTEQELRDLPSAGGRTVVLTGMSPRTARVEGPLTRVGVCAGIGGAPAIWPEGTVVVGESPLVLRIPGLGKVKVGDQLQGAASLLDPATDYLSVDIPKSCLTSEVIVFEPGT